MEQNDFKYISFGGYYQHCETMLEAALYLEKEFPIQESEYFLPDTLIYRPFKYNEQFQLDEKLQKNKLINYFSTLYKCDLLPILNPAIIECIKIDCSERHDVVRSFAVNSIYCSISAVGIDIMSDPLRSLRIFALVYALLYINNKEKSLNLIANCIFRKSKIEGTDFFENIFSPMKNFIEDNKSTLSFTLPKEVFYKDKLDEIDWRLETCNYDENYLKSIANSKYDKRVRMLVLGKILASFRKDRDKDYNLLKLTAESYLNSELSLLYQCNSETTIAYPSQLSQRDVITDNDVIKWFTQEFLMPNFQNCEFEDIKKVFLGTGEGNQIPLTVKKNTKKGDIALIICYLCQGEKVKEDTLIYFKKMIINQDGKPIFQGVNPLSAAKNKEKFYNNVDKRMRLKIGKAYEKYRKNIIWNDQSVKMP